MSTSRPHKERLARHTRSIEANLVRHRDAGAPDVAIQRGHALPRNFYSSYQLCFTSAISVNQASKIGEGVHHVYHIAVHLNLLGGQMVHCCLDSGLSPIDLKTKRTHLLLHNMQRADKNFEHLYEQCNVVSVIQVREDLLAKGCLG